LFEERWSEKYFLGLEIHFWISDSFFAEFMDFK